MEKDLIAQAEHVMLGAEWTSSMRFTGVSPAIVLRSWSFGESDRIVSFLTEGFGKVTGIAKGAKRSKRRFVNNLEPFSFVHLRFQERGQSSLVFILACDWVKAFRNITASLERIAHASYFLEITNELTREREECPGIFNLLKDGLIFLEEGGPSLSYVAYFEVQLLKMAGYQPMLDECRRCGRSCAEANGHGWFFSPQDGGILCNDCSFFRKEIIPLSHETLSALRGFQDYRRLDLSAPMVNEARSALLRFIQFQIHKELKSAPFLEDPGFC